MVACIQSCIVHLVASCQHFIVCAYMCVPACCVCVCYLFPTPPLQSPSPPLSSPPMGGAVSCRAGLRGLRNLGNTVRVCVCVYIQTVAGGTCGTLVQWGAVGWS